MSNAFEVEYFGDILPNFIDTKKRPLLTIHRKKNAKRERIVSGARR